MACEKDLFDSKPKIGTMHIKYRRIYEGGQYNPKNTVGKRLFDQQSGRITYHICWTEYLTKNTVSENIMSPEES